MAIARKIGKALSVVFVLAVAFAAGLFLTICRGLGGERRPRSVTTRPTSRPTTTRAVTRAHVDVPETQQGQPIPRNLLE